MVGRAFHRCLMVAIASMLVMPCRASGPAERFDDEPNELSWEYLAGSLPVFEMYEAVAAQAAAPAPRAAIDSARTFWTVRIPGTALAAPSAWRAGSDRGRTVLIGPAGHVGPAARHMIDVPAEGEYRLWVRWRNSPPENCSTRVRLRPAAAAEFTQGWQTLAEADHLDFTIGFVPINRPDYACDFQRDVAGMVWQCSPCGKLPRGPVLLEVVPTIHAGPYATRMIEQIWLTDDTIMRPSDDDATCPVPASVSVETSRRRPEHAARWAVYAARPGALAGPDRPPAHDSFRRRLIDRLARDEGLSADERHMAQLVHFDERWNLIGTPRQVRGRIETLGDPTNRMHGYAQWVEAEAFTIDRGWTSDPHGDASAGAALCSPYGDGPALATGTLHAPRAGRYRLWVRFAQLKGHYAVFGLAVSQEGGPVRDVEFSEIGPDRAANYAYQWHPVDLELRRGAVVVQLSKLRGKGPYAYRRVDALVLTDQEAWTPMGTEPPLPGSEAAVAPEFARFRASPQPVVFWTAAQDDRFTGLPWGAWPTPADLARCVPEPGTSKALRAPLELSACPGGEASGLVRLTNPTDTAFTAPIEVVAASGLEARANVVAFQITANGSWVAGPLLERSAVTVPPLGTAYVWLHAEAPGMGTATHMFRLAGCEFDVRVTALGKPFDAASAPLVSGWCYPPAGEAGLRMFQRVGVNVVIGRALPKRQMEAFGIKMAALTLGAPASAAEVQAKVAAVKALGLEYGDWAWIILDEPDARAVDAWLAAAKVIRAADPQVRIWCNPGEARASTEEVVRAMAPAIDVFCPYLDHFGRQRQPEYVDFVKQVGGVRLVYTTPCFQEKTPGAPLDLLSLAASAKALGRDGFCLFSLFNFYEATASAWDEQHAPLPDQAVSIYPGAYGRAISSRNLEAIRQAVHEW